VAFLDMVAADALVIVTEQKETTNATYYSSVANASTAIVGVWTPSPLLPDSQGARAMNRSGTFQTTAALAPNPDVRDTVTVGGTVFRVRPNGIRNTQFIVDFDLISVEAI
jgi:hypothetical protein